MSPSQKPDNITIPTYLCISSRNYLIFRKKAIQSVLPSNKAVTNALIYGFLDGFRVQN